MYKQYVGFGTTPDGFASASSCRVPTDCDSRATHHVDADSTADTDDARRNRDEKVDDDDEEEEDAMCGGAAGRYRRRNDDE